MKRILPGLYTFGGLLAGRVYLIEDTDGLTLIDAGLPIAGARILGQLREGGYRPADLKRILITHAHPDHVGGLPAIKQASGAEVIASKIEKPVIQGDVPVPRKDPAELSPIARLLVQPGVKISGTAVDRTVEDGEVLAEVMGGLQALLTPGHTPGHLAFWQPDRRILFVGDVIFCIVRLTLPLAIATVDMAENIRSIQRLAGLSPEVACFGHGSPMLENTAERIRAFSNKVAAA